MPFAVLVVVRGAADELGMGRASCTAAAATSCLPCMSAAALAAAVLAALGFVGLGLLALPIGAILAIALEPRAQQHFVGARACSMPACPRWR